jgi:hypothetical protein
MADEPVPAKKLYPPRQKCHLTYDATSISRQENDRFSSWIIQVEVTPPFDFWFELKADPHAVENGLFLTRPIGANVKICEIRRVHDRQ